MPGTSGNPTTSTTTAVELAPTPPGLRRSRERKYVSCTDRCPLKVDIEAFCTASSTSAADS